MINARGGPSAIAVLRILVREVPHFCSEKNCQTKLYTVLYMSDFQAFCTSSDTEKKKLQVSQEKAEKKHLGLIFNLFLCCALNFLANTSQVFLQCWFFVPVIYRFEFGFSKKQAKNWDCSVSQSQSLKILEKVSFNITSEASYIYILRRQKFIKNAKCSIWRDFENMQLTVKKVLPDRSNVKGQKFKWDIWGDFQIVWI